ncbi:acyl-CoA dehydrogenase family protein [Brachybacterium squillarum]|uniref:acyl-CoA dehydrogenase family protein n=1 Tax=Brachybacterium squillarum TaxID=661979 RepID=UPI002223479E|nr:acyl-CoA dehydrogenase family protein [Brachybacterium squillarum]MCW1805385.1 acyl-CoA/acyl-ACP dehydrogenase [Brachybacterium squillarum]
MTAESGRRAELGLATLPPSAGPVLDAVGRRARGVDQCEVDLWDSLRELGEHGLLAAPLPLAIELVHALARRCTASAFSLWGHRSALEYHEATASELPAGVREGTVALASGMAAAFKEEAGLGEIPLVAADRPGGAIEVSGTLPWCSNLRSGGWVIAPVRWEDGRRAVVRVERDAAGVTVVPLLGLTALDGTSSGVLRLDRTLIAGRDVLTEDLATFRNRVRAPFLLLQTAMCLGLAGAALDAAEGGADAASRRVFAEEAREMAEGWETLRSALESGAQASPSVPARELVSARLDAALLAGRATRLEQKVVGGRGYALGSDTSRRAREAAFLPVQSPTETHLRHLLAGAGAPQGPSRPTDGEATP